ncbi:MAG: sulfatase [Aggregatilineales bacterium]
MKAIMLMFDSLNRHCLPPYGCDRVKAPNFDRLAKRTVTFQNAYVGSMPCIPARRELHTGRYNFLHRSWGPLEPFDDSMPQLLGENGIYSHLVSDHTHYWEDGGATYHNRYSSWEIIRGQEGDAWKGHVADPQPPPNINGERGQRTRQDWVNRTYLHSNEAMPQVQTVDRGLEFITTNHAEDNWFLQIETFDPHEPFFTQAEFQDLYPHDYDGPLFDWPAYEHVSETPEQVAHLRYQYASLVSMCDAQLGRVLDAMDKYNLWQNTLLIVCTDHGFMLGEHEWWAKVKQPFYQEIAHIPLFIWDPRSQITHESRSSLVQLIDLPATLLDYFGVEKPSDMQGHTLKDVITYDTPVRDSALFGIHGGHINVTDGTYVYMRAPVNQDNAPLYEYTLMPTHMDKPFSPEELNSAELEPPFTFTKGCPVLKLPARPWVNPFPFGTLLFDVRHDPEQLNPITTAEPHIESRMVDLMKNLMQSNDAPKEQYDRLGLSE